jgi:uncharacterized protein
MLNQFFASARNKNQWYWYLLALLVLIVFVVIIPSTLLIIPSIISDGVDYDTISYNGLRLIDVLLVGEDVLRSIGMTIGVVIPAWVIHKRPWKSLINVYSNVRWERFFFGILLWFGFMVGAELIVYAIDSSGYTFQFEVTQWITLWITFLLIIPLHAFGKELLFRGYLMQGIGWGTKRPWIALVLTSIAFGCLFFLNPEIKTYGLKLVVTYVNMGLFLGIISLMDDGLELAIGVHIISNIYSSILEIFMTSELAMTFRIKALTDWSFLSISIIFYALFIWICAKKYGWADWGKLTRKIIDPNTNVDLELIDSIGVG